MDTLNFHTLYTNDQLSDTTITQIILVIYPNGISKASFNNNKQAIEIVSITTDDTTQYMQEMFFNDLMDKHLLTNKELITHIFIAPEQGMVIPATLHEPSLAEQWYRSINFVPKHHLIHQCPINNEEAMYMMHYPKYLLQTIDTHFENALLKPLVSSFINATHPNNTSISVHLHNAYCMLTQFDNGQLQTHQILHNHTLQEITAQLNIYLAEKNNYTIAVATNDTNINARDLIASYFGDQMQWMPVHKFYQQLAACE